ncbi:PAS domain S-box protein [bacterium]|nr:PAS domain S-box protein [bacterium]
MNTRKNSVMENDRKYHLLADNVSDVIFTLDMDLKYTYVSPSVYKLRGFYPEEVLGKSIEETLTPDSLETASSVFSKELELEKKGNVDFERSTILEVEMICKDGSTVWVEVKASFLRDTHGNPVSILGVTRDISERKKAEGQIKANMKEKETLLHKIRQSEARYRLLVENSVTGIGISHQGRILYGNKSLCEMLGVGNVEELCSKSLLAYATPESKKKIIDRMERLNAGESVPLEFEHDIIRKDGEIRTLSLKISSVQFNGLPCRQSTFLDITDKKRLETQLQKSEKRFREMAELLPGAVVELDTRLRVTYVNQAGFELFGYTLQDFENGIMGLNLLHPDDREKAARHIADTYQGNDVAASEYVVLGKDGTSIPVLLNSTPILENGEITGFRASITDISRVKKTESKLKESEKRYRIISELVSDYPFFAAVNQEGTFSRIWRWGDINTDLGIVTDPDNLFQGYQAAIHSDDVAKVADSTRAFMQGQNIDFEFRLHSPKLGLCWFHAKVQPVWDPVQNRVTHLYGALQNITEQKSAAEALKQSEKRFRAIFEQAAVGVALVHTPTAEILQINQKYADILGYTIEELTGKAIQDFTFQADHEQDLKTQAQALRREKREFFRQKRYVRKNGTVVWVNLFVSFLGDEDTTLERPLHIAVVEDITDLKNYQTELEEMTKIQELLIQEINHRVKNNLLTILGMLQHEGDIAGQTNQQGVKLILDRMNGRVQSLFEVHNLLSARGWMPLNLAELCRRLLDGIFHSSTTTRYVHYEISPSSVLVESREAHQLTLVINELISNSLKYATHEPDALHIKVTIEENEGQLILSFQDNGPGFPASILEGNWNPGGTGLRLIQGIVGHSLGGEIRLYNDPGAKVTLSRIRLNTKTA